MLFCVYLPDDQNKYIIQVAIMVTMTKGNILIDPTLYVQTIETTSKNQLGTLYYLPSRDRWTLSVPTKIYRETDWYWLCIIDRRFHPVQGTTPRHMPM